MVNFRNLFTATLLGTVVALPTDIFANAKAGDIIPNMYIVTLKPGQKYESPLSGIETKYAGNFNGFAGTFNALTLSLIRSNPAVAKIEENKVWSLSLIDEVQTTSETPHFVKRDLTAQSDATYGLAAVSHRANGATEYIHDSNAGEETFSRVEQAYTAYLINHLDLVGHGIHVACTIAGKTYGVARKATIRTVKVLQGPSTSTAIILKGFSWAVYDIISKGIPNKSVINMSLGGSRSDAVNNAIENAAAAGVLSAVAGVSPASAPSAITLGATNGSWEFASTYSNWGETVDILAPRTAVKSACIYTDSSTRSISGTSMASPHIAGLALYAISVDGVSGVQVVTDHLVNTATKDAISGHRRGTPNRLGNNNNPQQ